MILIQQRYSSADPARQAELDRVRALNGSLDCFEQIVELDGALRRWTFGDVFALAADQHRGSTIVLANSDIAFDRSIVAVEGLLRPNVLVALTRWDDATAPSMEGRVDPATWRFFSQSQDTWIFTAGGLPAFEAGFRLGVPRCENRLAFEAAAAGVVVVNPALDIHTHHHHASHVRSWKRGEHYRGPLLFPRLTTLHAARSEALVVWRTWRRLVRTVDLDGSAESFSRQLARPPEQPGRLGVRSPLYWRA